MYVFGLADKLLRLLVPIAICLTTYLYLYPAFHACTFPTRDASAVTAFTDTFRQHWNFLQSPPPAEDPSRIPIRFLVLADPQLEGDSSLPSADDGFLPKLERHWERLRGGNPDEILTLIAETTRQIWLDDIPEALQALRKRLDLFGNDYYLGHIFRTLHWWTNPTHVTVLGDLIGSQWVTDEEFEWRGWRFWNRVFAHGKRVEDEITTLDSKEEERILNMTDASWKNRIINIAGNHDVGYAGEISQNRVDRFERVFGNANWDVRFRYPYLNGTGTSAAPSLHLIVLNSLILDKPAFSEDLQIQTYDYLNGLISHRLPPVEDRSSFTLLLTHLPLHKKKGICVDAPFFDHWGNDDGGGVYKPRGLKEQNHLSEHTSHQGTLEALFGMTGNIDAPAGGRGRNGLILTGHDHEGCDVWHSIPSESTWSSSSMDNKEQNQRTKWEVSKWRHSNHSDAHTGIREVTLRSMMGDYGGNAGLLSAWFDFEAGEWKYDIHMCGLNVKLWWTVHVIDLVVLGSVLFSLVGRSLSLAKIPRANVKHESATKATKANG